MAQYRRILGDFTVFTEAERLARSVVAQACIDAGVLLGANDERTYVPGITKSEAISFLTSSVGSWKQSREWWCAAAGLNADELRRRSMRLLGLENEPEPQPAAVMPPLAPKPPPPRGPRPGTKLAALVDLLGSPAGITLDEMMERFGWSRVTCSTAISGDLPHKFGIRSKRGPDGRYRLVQAA